MPSVVFEPILGGARPMRGGADPTPPCTARTMIPAPAPINDIVDVPAWQWHIKADIAHDGGAAILGYTSMNLAAVYGGQNTKTVPRAPWDMLPLDEDVVRDKLLASDLYKDRAGRPSVHFLLRPATDQFTDVAGKSIVFDPFPKQAIAVYHDAGLPMHTRIPGARNGRSYGQAIDPAPKPVDDGDFVDKVVGSFAIPGCTFGFNPVVVGDIVIADFNGIRVKVGIYIKIGAEKQLYNAATGTIVGSVAELTYKQINKPTGLFAGNGANGRMTGSPNDIPYFIGKAICDAIQVAALMPKLWKQNGEVIPNIWTVGQILRILNTGDRLEYVRAVLLGVSCIYLGPKDAETKARTGVFTPGSDAVKSDGQLRKEYNKKLQSILPKVLARWGECERDIEASYQGGFVVAYSYFGGVSYVDMNKPEQVVAATAFMMGCSDAIFRAGKRTLNYFKDSITASIAVESVADKIAAYSQLLSELDSHCPPGAILRRSNMPQVFRVSSTETTEVTIKFFKAFEAIRNGTLILGPALVVKGYEDVEEDVAGGARPKNQPPSSIRNPKPDPNKDAMAERQAERLALRRGRVDRYSKASPTCVNLVNAFTCLVNAEQSRILGIRFPRDAGGKLLPNANPKVYYSKLDSELANEWTALSETYKGKADLSTLEQSRVEISDEVNAGYDEDPKYAIRAGVVARVVADKKNQNDFTEFVKFLFSDLTYPSPHRTKNVDVEGDGWLVFEDRGIASEEKQTFKAVRCAFMILRLAGGFRVIEPDFYNELYGQAALLMSIASAAPEPVEEVAPEPLDPIAEAEAREAAAAEAKAAQAEAQAEAEAEAAAEDARLDSMVPTGRLGVVSQAVTAAVTTAAQAPVAAAQAAAAAADDDEEFGGSRRKTHRRRLPKLI